MGLYKPVFVVLLVLNIQACTWIKAPLYVEAQEGDERVSIQFDTTVSGLDTYMYICQQNEWRAVTLDNLKPPGLFGKGDKLTTYVNTDGPVMIQGYMFVVTSGYKSSCRNYSEFTPKSGERYRYQQTLDKRCVPVFYIADENGNWAKAEGRLKPVSKEKCFSANRPN